jgi:chromosome segregation ATPase
MKEILAQAQNLLASLVAKEAEATQTLALVREREANVKARELRNDAYESAAEVLAAADERRRSADAKLVALEDERAKLENDLRKEREAIAAEIARLQPLQDREKQLASDRASLYAREEALEVEKKAYKVRYIAKIKAHFANTGGVPNPDDIT